VNMDQNTLLKLLMTHVQDVVLVISMKGDILALNASAECLYGWKAQRVVKKNYFKLCENQEITPFILKKTLPKLSDSLSCVYETSIIDQTQLERIISWKINKIIDQKQKTAYVVAVGQDITALKKIENKQKDTANYLRCIMEYIPGYVFWKDQNLKILGCNANFAKVANETVDSIIGKSDYGLPWTKVQADQYRTDDLDVMLTSCPKLNIEETMRYADGSQAALLTHKMPLKNTEGKVIGVIGIFSDITDRKKAENELREAKEQLEIANQAKSQFIANMEHDIRTPASGIASLTALLASTETEPTKKENLELLANSAEQLLTVLTEILEFHSIEDGQAPLLEKRFSLRRIIQNVVNLEVPIAKMKDLKLETKIAANIPEFLIGDDFRTYRILLNLIGNSVKFTKKGKVTINVNLTENKKKTFTIKTLIADTGIGIPKDKQNEVFEKFSRLSPSSENHYTGSGLGLRVVKQFINEMGGEIYVESELGKGTTFTCLIPYKKCLANESLEESVSINQTTLKIPQLPKTRVLLVEDDQIAKLVEQDILKEKFGCLLDIASNGNAAIRISKNKKYDLIFMDLGLPDMDGKKLTIYLRAQGCKTPIIALTAHGLGKKEECIAAGMSDFLIKPISVEKVTNIVKKWLPRHIAKAKTKKKDINLNFAMRLHKNKELVNVLLKKLLNKFSVVKKDLKNIEKNKDFKKIYAILHNLKGACSYCGATKLQKALSTLEKKEINAENIQQIYKKLFDAIDATRLEIEKILKIKQ